MQRFNYVRHHYGIISGTFLAGYAIFRFFVEYTREPDTQLGFVLGHLSMGQVLCIPMALAGLGIIIYAIQHKNPRTP